MQVAVVLEQRFTRTPDGAVWVPSTFLYEFGQRYLEVFDQVKVIARVCDVASVPDDHKRVDGQGVEVAAVPYYHGPWQYLKARRRVIRASRSFIGQEDAIILRLPSAIASCVYPVFRRTRHPYGVEVIGDPYDVFAPGVVQHELRVFFRWWFTRMQKSQCADSSGAAYVTQYYLQKRYPCAITQVGVSDVELGETALAIESRSFTTYYSSVDLDDVDFSGREGSALRARHCIRLIMVGSLEQLYKGPDILLNAVAQYIRNGLDLELAIIRDGKYRTDLVALSMRLGVSDRVHFLGMLPSGVAP
jgi:glycosyltransferase involved in cell wall biosynthesis